MIGRVTTSTMTTAGAARLMASKTNLAAAQDAAGSLKRITKPSDDPRGTAQLLGIQQAQARTVQYGRNVNDGQAWLQTADSALSSTNTLMVQARDLMVQAGNGTLNQTAKDALATQIDGIKSELLARANTTYLGRTVFAGTSDAGTAFDASGNFTGVAGSSVTRTVGDGVSVAVDVNGAAVFGSGSGSVFSLLDGVSASLRAGTGVSDKLAALDTRISAVTAAQADVGVRTTQIQRASDLLSTQGATLESQRANVADIDLSQAILDLQTQELNYKSALAVTARVLPNTLMDFLK